MLIVEPRLVFAHPRNAGHAGQGEDPRPDLGIRVGICPGPEPLVDRLPRLAAVPLSRSGVR
jgi:hypothetical protein